MNFLIYVIFNFLIFSPFILFLFFKDKFKDRNHIHLYGIYGYFGLPGKGKTMAMCYQLDYLRRRYKNKIYICTNFNYKDEDFSFVTWKQLLADYDKPLIVAWDEVQNEFNSRDFKNFPIELLTKLTQVRKGNGIQILYTAQRWHFVDKNFRSLSFGCYQCATWFGRFTFTRMYTPDQYDDLCNQTVEERKRKIKPVNNDYFIQTDKLRNSYDSFKMLETAKTKEYMTREEIALLSHKD